MVRREEVKGERKLKGKGRGREGGERWGGCKIERERERGKGEVLGSEGGKKVEEWKEEGRGEGGGKRWDVRLRERGRERLRL